MELELFNLSFEEPIEGFEGKIINLGSAVASRSGVWVFEARDITGTEASAEEIGLPRSKHLESAFAYVKKSNPKGLMALPNLTFKRKISTLRISYVPVFTKTPVRSEQFGPLVYLTSIDASNLSGHPAVNLAWRAGCSA